MEFCIKKLIWSIEKTDDFLKQTSCELFEAVALLKGFGSWGSDFCCIF